MKQREKLWTQSEWRVLSEKPHIVNTADGSAIADAWGFHIGDKQMLANAQLISAAPDLVEALEQMLSQFGGSAIQDMAVTSVLDQAEYALAKAYGDSQ